MLSFFPRDVLDEILTLIESVSVGFPTYSSIMLLKIKIYIFLFQKARKVLRTINSAFKSNSM